MLHGKLEPGYEPLARTLEQILRGPPYGGAAICLYEDGKPVVDLWGGVKNPQGDPWEENTPSVSYSTSKGVAATALHMCKDRGLVRYDDPVAKYWPEFGQRDKGAITVRQVLTHAAGLYDVRNIVGHADLLLDWDATIRALELAPASHPAGRHHGYHAVTFGHLVGEIVRRVSGKPFSQFIQDEIAKPLGLENFFIGASEEAIQRSARNMGGAPGRDVDETTAHARAREETTKQNRLRLIALGLNMVGIPMNPDRLHRALYPRGVEMWDFSSPEVLRACIPAANGLFSARDLARLYACLGNGGSLDGVRLLSTPTIREATQVQWRGPDGVLVAPMRWRLGYHAVFSRLGIVKAGFGHAGYNGSGAWACPLHGAAFGFVVNAGMGTPIGDWRLLKLTTVALACLKARRRRGGVAA